MRLAAGPVKQGGDAVGHLETGQIAPRIANIGRPDRVILPGFLRCAVRLHAQPVGNQHVDGKGFVQLKVDEVIIEAFPCLYDRPVRIAGFAGLVPVGLGFGEKLQTHIARPCRGKPDANAFRRDTAQDRSRQDYWETGSNCHFELLVRLPNTHGVSAQLSSSCCSCWRRHMNCSACIQVQADERLPATMFVRLEIPGKPGTDCCSRPDAASCPAAFWISLGRRQPFTPDEIMTASVTFFWKIR